MTRIIAGTAGGRRIETPPGRDTRPTSDRVREALFAALEARGAVRGRRVLDLYAGSGALGLEAASRGAEQVTLVESARAAVQVIRRNVAALGLDGVRIVAGSVAGYLDAASVARFDLALLDPPYPLAEPELAAVLARLGGVLADGALCVVERSSRSPEPTWPPGLAPEGVRRYGETALWTARRSADVLDTVGE